MDKHRFRKNKIEILMVILGGLLFTVALTADSIGAGTSNGFGNRQFDLAFGGGLLFFIGGLLLIVQYNGWSYKFGFLTNARVIRDQEDKPLYPQLTHEIIASSNVHNIKVYVIGTIFLTLFLNFSALRYLDLYLYNPSGKTVSQKWEMLQRMQQAVNWLILGDSTGNQGIVPEILESHLGGSAINLCTIGPMTLLNDVWMLETYIDKFGPPENVIIVHTHFLDAEVDPLTIAKIPLPWGISRKYRFSSALISIKDQIEISIARHLPLYFANRELRDIFWAGFFSPNSLLRQEYQVDLTSRGYMPVFAASPQAVETELKENLESLEKADFIVSDASRVAAERLIALANQHKINVYILQAPIYEKLYENDLFQRHLRKIQEWWEDVDKRSDYITFFPQVIMFPIDQLQETVHVTHSGAIIYTNKISLEIIKTQHEEAAANLVEDHN